jgi:hypothetical protein
MGVNKSKQLVESITEITNNTLNKSVTDISNTASADQFSVQSAEMDYSGSIMEECNVILKQSAELNSTIKVLSDTAISANVANAMQTDIQETLKNSLTQANKGINLGQANISDVQTKTKTLIENNLKNIVETSIRNVVESSQGNKQVGKIIAKGITCKGSNFEIDQTVLMTTVAENISKNIVDNVLTNDTLTKVVKDIENKVSQKNTGISLLGLLVGLLFLAGIGFVGYKASKGGLGGMGGVMSTMTSPPAAYIFMAMFVALMLLILFDWLFKTGDEDEEPSAWDNIKKFVILPIVLLLIAFLIYKVVKGDIVIPGVNDQY